MKKVLSILLTVALILSLNSFGVSKVFAADYTDPIWVTSGQTWTGAEGDNVNITNQKNAVTVESHEGTSSSAKINGNVSLVYENVQSYSYLYGVLLNCTNGIVSADVSGDVSVYAVPDSGSMVYGVRMQDKNGDKDVTFKSYIGGNVSSVSEMSSIAYDVYNVYVEAETAKNLYAVGFKARALDFIASGSLKVGGDIISETVKYDENGDVVYMGADADAGVIRSKGDATVDIKGGIIAEGKEARGAILTSFSDDNLEEYRPGNMYLSVGEKGITVNALKKSYDLKDANDGIRIINAYAGNTYVDVKGDINISLKKSSSSANGIYIKANEERGKNPGPFYNKVHVHGDVNTDDVGIRVESVNDLDNTIIVEGTISTKNTPIVQDFFDDSNAKLNLIVWKIAPRKGSKMFGYEYDRNGVEYFDPPSEFLIDDIVNYIIKTEQPSEGGTFTVVKEDGNVLDTNEGFETAHEGEKVYIKPELEEGATLKAAYNGQGENKVELEKDEGGYFYVVPKGGGVYLSVDIEVPAKPTPTPEPKDEQPTPTPEPTDVNGGQDTDNKDNVSQTATPTPDANSQDGNGQDKADDITKEIPFAENIPVEEKQTVIESANTDKNDVAGSTMKYLGLKAAKVKKNSIKLTWKKVKGADGYIIYGNKCGNKMKYITTINKGTVTSYTAKKLKKGTYYKYMVVAYKTTASGDKVITTSKSVHAATTGGKVGNPTSIKVKKTKVSLKNGKTKKIKASFKKKKKVHLHIAKFRYESLDESIATVSKSGKIKGVGKGTTKVLVYTQNGLSKTIKVTVK